MSLLAISTGLSKSKIALLDTIGGKVLAENLWPAESNEAEKLMPNIDDLVCSTGQKFTDIEEVLVVKGPGSFTGLRIGVTVGNTIAYLNQARLYGVTTFDYFWTMSSRMDSALLIFAGKGGVYVSLNNRSEELVKIDELNDYLKSHDVSSAFGEISSEQKALLKDVKFVETEEKFGEAVLKLYAGGIKDVKIVEPLYIKKPGITERKEDLKKR